jgi:hypothetical protein
MKIVENLILSGFLLKRSKKKYCHRCNYGIVKIVLIYFPLKDLSSKEEIF